MRNQTRVVVCDFDGVICDGSAECALVVWNAYHHNETLEAFSDPGINGLPKVFLDRFRRCRPFTRELGHFIVPLLDPRSSQITTQAAFDRVFGAIEADVVERFSRAVTAYRAAVRLHSPDVWVGQHKMYPGTIEAIMHSSFPVFIVTAKDADSVLALLGAYGLRFPADRISGVQREKTTTLMALARTRGIAPSDVIFIDDNVANSIAAKGAGFNSLWASWGFSSPDAPGRAQRAGIPALSLAALPGLLSAPDANEPITTYEQQPSE